MLRSATRKTMRSATQKRNDNKEDKRNRKFLPESLLPGASGVVASKVVEALIEPELLHRGGRGRGGDTQSTKSGSLGRDDKRGTRRTSSQHAHKQTTRKQHHLRGKKSKFDKKEHWERRDPPTQRLNVQRLQEQCKLMSFNLLFIKKIV